MRVRTAAITASPKTPAATAPSELYASSPMPKAVCALVRALAVETHKNWMEANRYIKLDDLLARHAPSRTMAAQIC